MCPRQPALRPCQDLPGPWKPGVWSPHTGHHPPSPLRPHGPHFEHLPRAPGDQRMVTATWSWQAYWLMVMFWASAITCFPTGFKYVVQSGESWEENRTVTFRSLFFFFPPSSFSQVTQSMPAGGRIHSVGLRSPNSRKKVDCLEK